MAKTYSPQVPFRGTRAYVHSPEVYDSLLAGAEKLGFGAVEGLVRISLRKLARRQLRYFFRDPDFDGARNPEAVLDFALGVGGQVIDGWAEETDEDVTERRPYDESPIHDAAEIEGDKASVSRQTPYSPFEVAASVSVLLHNTTSPPPAGLKWLASRYDLKRPFADSDGTGMEVEIVHRLGAKMTKSEIRCAGERLGYVYFSLGPP